MEAEHLVRLLQTKKLIAELAEEFSITHENLLDALECGRIKIAAEELRQILATMDKLKSRLAP